MPKPSRAIVNMLRILLRALDRMTHIFAKTVPGGILSSLPSWSGP